MNLSFPVLLQMELTFSLSFPSWPQDIFPGYSLLGQISSDLNLCEVNVCQICPFGVLMKCAVVLTIMNNLRSSVSLFSPLFLSSNYL